jgi:hypothetical protein
MEVAVLGGSRAQEGPDYTIKPQFAAPSIDTSEWPLLLQHYDRRGSHQNFPIVSSALY